MALLSDLLTYEAVVDRLKKKVQRAHKCMHTKEWYDCGIETLIAFAFPVHSYNDPRISSQQVFILTKSLPRFYKSKREKETVQLALPFAALGVDYRCNLHL